MRVYSILIFLIAVLFLVSSCQIYQTVYPTEVPKENKTITKEVDSRGTKIDDKIYPYLKQTTQPSWVDNGDGTWNLMVQCYYDINTTQCRDRLQTYGIVKERIGINLFEITVHKDNIRSIAEDDYVLAIDRRPGPYVPHE